VCRCPLGAKLRDWFANGIYRLTSPKAHGIGLRAVIVGAFTIASIGGAWWLMPPTDYLPRGNKNLVFGFLITPPGYNIEHYETIGKRVESKLRPYWEAAEGTGSLQAKYDKLEDVPSPIQQMPGQPPAKAPPTSTSTSRRSATACALWWMA